MLRALTECDSKQEALGMSDSSNARTRNATDAVKRGAEVAANGIYQATDFVVRNDGRIADGAQAVTGAVGSGIDKAGRGLASVSQQASRVLHGNANSAAERVREAITGSESAGGVRKAAGALGWFATKALAHTAGFVAEAAAVGGKAVAATGRLTESAAPAVGGTAGGLVRGAASMASNTVDSLALPATRIEEMRKELRMLGQMEMARSEQRMQAIESAQKRRRKDELLDLLVVAGVTLSQVLREPADVPENVQQAFALAYPGLAQTETFSDAVARMSSDELVGLVSGVKGKLFELELVDHLNSGGLPDGYHAEIAGSATQPGWDIRVLDENGRVSELLQAKATESAQYVQEALQRYPDIDVTTTTEVHAQLVALGLAENVQNSGISEAVLQAKVEAAAAQSDAIFAASDLVPSSIGLAVIALSVFMKKDASLREKGEQFGQRSAKAGVSAGVGNALMVASQTWWLALIGGVATSWLAGRGLGKREQYEALKSALEVMQGRQMALPVTPKLLAIKN